MAYNIDTIEIVYSNGFELPFVTWTKLRDRFDGNWPESSVLEKAWIAQMPAENGVTRPTYFWWCGEGSARTYDTLVEVLSAFDGDADLVLTWEGGDSVDGLRLRDHKVTKHRVNRTLGDEIELRVT